METLMLTFSMILLFVMTTLAVAGILPDYRKIAGKIKKMKAKKR